MDISIIIVTYNSEKHISPLLTSIKRSKDKLKKEVIIVDNASSDDTLKVVRKHSLKPKVIASPLNAGFSKGVNQGIRKASGKYILLLNPDTRLYSSTLEKLYQFAQKTKPLGAAVPRLTDMNGKPQASAFYFPTVTNAVLKNFFGQKKRFGKYLPDNRTQKLDVAVMAAFLLPRSTLDKIGLLDERFFLYYEDIEFCRRLKRARLPLYYYPAAKVKHAHGASGNFKQHLNSPLLASSKIYYGSTYSTLLNTVLWIGHKWQVILKGKRFRD